MKTFRVTGASCHTTSNFMKSYIQSQLNRDISLISRALQCKKVQSSIENFHWSKKLRKIENFSFKLKIRVPLESVNLFLHVFLCLKVILTIEHYIKLLTIFIWKFAIFWSWQLTLWNLGQLAPALFFTCNRITATIVEIFILLFGKRTSFKIIYQLIALKRRLMSITWKLRV